MTLRPIPLVILAPLLLTAAASCGGEPPRPPAPSLDAESVSRQAEMASQLDVPYRILFEWTLNEPGMRLNGRGVARVEPPFRARLDLFASNGERMAAAALIEDEFRVPPGLGDFLPSPAFLWGSLGIVRPGLGTFPIEAERVDRERSTLRYRVAGGGNLDYDLRNRRVQRIEFTSSQGAREELRLTRGEGERFPREALYRDHGATRELRLRLESAEYVEAYPSNIWSPGS